MSADDESEKFIRLASADLTAAQILYDEDGRSLIICFHAQQVVEKGLKAVLIKKKVIIRKIHDLVELSDLIQDLSKLTFKSVERILVTPLANKVASNTIIGDIPADIP